MFENNGMNRVQWMKKISIIVLGSVIAAYGITLVPMHMCIAHSYG